LRPFLPIGSEDFSGFHLTIDTSSEQNIALFYNDTINTCCVKKYFNFGTKEKQIILDPDFMKIKDIPTKRLRQCNCLCG